MLLYNIYGLQKLFLSNFVQMFAGALIKLGDFIKMK